jgi:hypothetical protein
MLSELESEYRTLYAIGQGGVLGALDLLRGEIVASRRGRFFGSYTTEIRGSDPGFCAFDVEAADTFFSGDHQMCMIDFPCMERP